MEPIFYIFFSIIFVIWITKVALGKIRNLPPSPFPCLPIVGHLYLLRSRPLYRALGKLSAHHGPMLMLRLGACRVFLVSSTEVVEECLTTNDLSFANRPVCLRENTLGWTTPPLIGQAIMITGVASAAWSAMSFCHLARYEPLAPFV